MLRLKIDKMAQIIKIKDEKNKILEQRIAELTENDEEDE